MTPLVWVLVIYLPQFAGATIDSAGAITMPTPLRSEINMPSHEICQQIAALNSNEASCWAHEPDPIKVVNTDGTQTGNR